MNVGELELLWALRFLGVDDRSDMLIFTSYLLVKIFEKKCTYRVAGCRVLKCRGEIRKNLFPNFRPLPPSGGVELKLAVRGSSGE